MIEDGAGNLIKRIGSAPVLWSCHTDTVHRSDGRQNVRVDDGRIRLARGDSSSCLGADDGAGVWLASEMIRAGVEGLYVFHRGEEIGGIGSTYIAEEKPDLLEGITMAIAFDRKGRDSVITHQGARCCSDTFALSLGKAIGLGMEPDAYGLFTDTANYTHLIPECTNLSVGYDAAHSALESLDVPFLLKLRESLLALDVHRLKVQRDHTVRETDRYEDWKPRDWATGEWSRGEWNEERWTQAASPLAGDYHRLLRVVEDEPDAVADFLAHNGFTAEDVERWTLK